MDRYTRYRGGSVIWADSSNASVIINNDFFGAPTPVHGNTFYIKVSGVWKPGEAFVKAGTWKTATAMIKNNNTWL